MWFGERKASRIRQRLSTKPRTRNQHRNLPRAPARFPPEFRPVVRSQVISGCPVAATTLCVPSVPQRPAGSSVPMSGPIHAIRLKGPWDVRPPDHSSDDTGWERRSMPCAWRDCFGDAQGIALFRRNFHRPTGLEAGNRVCLRLPEGAGDVVSLSVNGIAVAADAVDSSRFDCTRLLEAFNRLEIALKFDPQTAPGSPGGLWETVHLEIW